MRGTADSRRQQAPQEHRALGLRAGYSYGYSGELSYQRELRRDRLELNLGAAVALNEMYVTGTALYQWLFPLAGGWAWYVGVGGKWSIWNHDHPYYDDSGYMLSAAGNIGLEYLFARSPWQLSLDWRPAVTIDGPRDMRFRLDGVGLAVRYRF